eukprot:563449-Heterocapsa_arctica.AAC.1
MRTDQLDHMQACRLLCMILRKECGGGFHDRRHQRGDHYGDRRVDKELFLDQGKYKTEDKVHRLLPGNQTAAERKIEQ